MLAGIAELMNMSDRTDWWYISLFKRGGDVVLVQPVHRRNRPKMLIGKFEQVTFLRLIPRVCKPCCHVFTENRNGGLHFILFFITTPLLSIILSSILGPLFLNSYLVEAHY